MFARVAFGHTGNANGIVIPRDAIVGSVKDAQVYVVENNIAKLRSIIVNDQIGTGVEVGRGLREGELVVINGQNNLKDNTPVTVISK
jgi:hypothetical protein